MMRLLTCCMALGLSTGLAIANPAEQDARDRLATSQSAEDTQRYYMDASAQFRALLVADEDPANDRSLVYALSAGVTFPVDGLSASIKGGFSEVFVAEAGDSAFRLSDTAIGVRYGHRYLQDRLAVNHALDTWLPTSRSSLARELRVAPTFSTGVTYRAWGPLKVRYGTVGQYRWYRYAEVPNNLAMNTQWVIGQSLGLSAAVLESERFGRVDVFGGSGMKWARKYNSADTHSAPSSDGRQWSQLLNWNVGVNYSPLPYLGIGTGIEHGAPLRRNGIINPQLANRDLTELYGRLSARY